MSIDVSPVKYSDSDSEGIVSRCAELIENFNETNNGSNVMADTDDEFKTDVENEVQLAKCILLVSLY